MLPPGRQVEYPEIEEGIKPRHRFMSAYEQRVETADKGYQYLLFAAEPYETIAFKVPNWEVEKNPSNPSGGGFFSHWDPDGKTFSLQVRAATAWGAAPPGAVLHSDVIRFIQR